MSLFTNIIYLSGTQTIDLRDDDILKVQVFDKNNITEDIAIGEARISIREAVEHSDFAITDCLSQTSPMNQQQLLTESAYAPSAPPPESYAPISDASPLNPSNQSHIFLDHVIQRAMSLRYKLQNQGYIHLFITPTTYPDPVQCVRANDYKRFQLNKMLMGADGGGQSGVKGRISKLGLGVKHQMDKIQPVHAALNFVQPVHDVFQEHSTWKINMYDVDHVFHGKRHGWNKSYTAAQKIFSGPTSHLVRGAIQLQHSYLYGGGSGIKILQEFRRGIEQVTGSLLDYDDFITLLNGGMRRGKPRMFTYVLMENKLYLAETGAHFFRDMRSKHAMHCSGAEEVVYAGELHFRRGPPGSDEPAIRLVVDNNSGTYAPGQEDLPRVAEVFRRNFPGLPVQALDFQDPMLKQYATEVKQTTRDESRTSQNLSTNSSMQY